MRVRFKPIPKLKDSDLARFWGYVDATPGHGPNGDCWVWTGAKGKNGYGILSFYAIGSIIATRLGYFIQTGEDPEEQLVCHACDFPACIRMDHLFLSNTKGNMSDAARKGRSAKGPHHGSVTHPDAVPHGSGHANSKLTEEDVKAIRERYALGGVSATDLAKEYGVVMSNICFILKANVGWKHADGPTFSNLRPRGEMCGSSRITEDTVRAIRAERAKGAQYRDLSVKYNLSYGAVHALCNGKTWKHVTQ